MATWIEATGEVSDACPDDDVWTDERLDQEATTLEVRPARIFEDEPTG